MNEIMYGKYLIQMYQIYASAFLSLDRNVILVVFAQKKRQKSVLIEGAWALESRRFKSESCLNNSLML